MPSLAELPEITGFFSYSRDDDDDFERPLSSLREAINKELRAQLGRTKQDFRLWQDQNAIAPGEMWESQIAAAIDSASFFIPIVTPRSVNSRHCKFEFDTFLARERALGRNNLVFPILYIAVPALADESKWRNDPVLSTIGARQYVDWREYRQWTTDAPAYRKAIIDFCASIAAALREPWATPEERRRQELDFRQRKEAEARNEAKAAQRRRAEQEEAARRTAEQDRRSPADTATQGGEKVPKRGRDASQGKAQAASKFGPIWKSVLVGLAAAVGAQIWVGTNVAAPLGMDIATVVGGVGLFAGLIAYFFFRSRSSPTA
jgi:hypothetical protein